MSMNGGNMFAPKEGKPEVLYSVQAQRGGFDKRLYLIGKR